MVRMGLPREQRMEPEGQWGGTVEGRFLASEESGTTSLLAEALKQQPTWSASQESNFRGG